MGRHAKLSPSGWKQWGTCAGSIHLINKLKSPDKSSQYAAEGSVAHWVHESCLLNNNKAADYVGQTKEIDGFKFKVSVKMAEAVQTSIDYIHKRVFEAESNDMRVVMIVEKWVSLEYLNINGLDGGTADVILIFYDNFDDSVSEVEVVDYKHGAGVSVEPDNNGQGMMYALATTEIDELKGIEIETIKITISQPRCFSADGPIKSWAISHINLIEWEHDELIPRAKATLPEDAPLVPSVDGCRFCDAKGDCKALYELTIDTAMMDFADEDKKTAKLTIEQKLKIVKNKAVINMFFEAVTSKIFDEILSGSEEYANHFKLVRAKTNRQLVDGWEDEIVFHVDDDEELYNKKPKALGELEKILDKAIGKKERVEFMKEITVKPEGGLTMVTLDDKRNEVLTGAQDEDWD